MTITNLNDITKEQVRTLLEIYRVTIKKTANDHFIVLCPDCNKPEAYTYFKPGTKFIECNRKNECGFKLNLWEYIADKQGISPRNNYEMLKYINNTLGLEFNDFKEKEVNSDNLDVGGNNKSKFLNDCYYIFLSMLIDSAKKDKTSHTLKYLKDRGYTEEQIKSFGLGFLPDYQDLVNTLISDPYCYDKDLADELVKKYFEGVIKVNGYQKQEEGRNRITFTWRNVKGEVAGFSIRKPTNNKELQPKYMNNNEMNKAELLFNLDNTGKKAIVIVEGLLDALNANYYISQQAKNSSYHFVATGNNNISDRQAECLKSAGYLKVILLPDKDEAGKGFLTSANKLTELSIETYIASIPDKYSVKDIDELLRKNPEINLISMLRKSEPILQAGFKGAIDNDSTRENVKSIIRKAIENKEKIDIPVEIKTSAKAEDNKEIEKNLVKALDKDVPLKELLRLANNYNASYYSIKGDEPYNEKDFIKDIAERKQGLETGFKELDRYITIQPQSLVFIAGRPSHGKTTVMLNMLRNMLEIEDDIDKDKPELEKTYKSFSFYSYEEPENQIVLKLILGVSEKDKDITLQGEGITYQQKVENHIKTYYGTDKMSNKIDIAWQKVFKWVNSGRLQILGRQPSVESLSSAIIERIAVSEKPTAAVFVDYIQKLNSGEIAKKGTRQMELQSVCQVLLNTALEAKTPIILGAQMNREVNSLASLSLDNLRECGDIEQDANIVLGVWDEEIANVEKREKQLEMLINKSKLTNEEVKEKSNLERELQNYESPIEKKLIIKVLKNRNGKRNNRVAIELNCPLLKINN